MQSQVLSQVKPRMLKPTQQPQYQSQIIPQKQSQPIPTKYPQQQQQQNQQSLLSRKPEVNQFIMSNLKGQIELLRFELKQRDAQNEMHSQIMEEEMNRIKIELETVKNQLEVIYTHVKRTQEL
ncbi:Hypothetical_protein [Hexamita inflata]|uniref:Hypothetical_protein n=1 Tax=Hexamita inflata TaxID=28002 RepID=A0AA86TRF8_9EUKA|nr:Hypothetical protein HINF_LOCUS14024 [Hexamita inflata]